MIFFWLVFDYLVFCRLVVMLLMESRSRCCCFVLVLDLVGFFGVDCRVCRVCSCSRERVLMYGLCSCMVCCRIGLFFSRFLFFVRWII